MEPVQPLFQRCPQSCGHFRFVQNQQTQCQHLSQCHRQSGSSQRAGFDGCQLQNPAIRLDYVSHNAFLWSTFDPGQSRSGLCDPDHEVARKPNCDCQGQNVPVVVGDCGEQYRNVGFHVQHSKIDRLH